MVDVVGVVSVVTVVPAGVGDGHAGGGVEASLMLLHLLFAVVAVDCRRDDDDDDDDDDADADADAGEDKDDGDVAVAVGEEDVSSILSIFLLLLLCLRKGKDAGKLSVCMSEYVRTKVTDFPSKRAKEEEEKEEG